MNETQDNVSVAQYKYDDYGNRIAGFTPKGGINAYYVGQDRLISYNGNQYSYTLNGELASKTVSSQTTHYNYDALVQGFIYQDQLNPISELDGNNNVVARFVYGSTSNIPDYLVKDGQTFRFFSDHLGSPILVVNVQSGQIIQEMGYDEFGNVIQDTNPGFQPFGFAGGIYDQHTKLTRFAARDYDAKTVR